MSNLLDSQGIFWWGGTVVPDGFVAPSASIAGHLTVNASGVTELQLLGLLTPGPEAFTTVFKPSEILNENLTIHGILTGGKGHVVLGRLQRNGSTIANSGISIEAFRALDCLFSKESFRPAKIHRFRTMTLDVSGLAEWFGNDGIVISNGRRMYKVSVKMPRAQSFKVDDVRLTVYHRASPSFSVPIASVRTLDIKQFTLLEIKNTKSLELEYYRDEVQHVENLFTLLTGHRVNLPWPRINGRDGSCKYYFGRSFEELPRLKLLDCWTSWTRVSGAFGTLYNALKRGSDDFGPGLHLYLGTRRQSTLFVENRFTNLIWGLESLHRRTAQPRASERSPLQEKIDRIIGQISLEKDRNWLSKKLKNAGEPSLEERLFELFSELPLDFDLGGLREFSKECAKRRNDISHFGGDRGGAYAEFSARLRDITTLLLDLYHALLLYRIGLDSDMLRAWFHRGPSEYKYRMLFNHFGLSKKPKPSHAAQKANK
ncbi:HEPN domain-containing protein [Pandoraea pnomenusa]|uniref:Uncharacterized protein n=1 Tax=Pandoraea pnomenusa TaxID=93220 RepID=A0A378YX14_9BURK|nr:HEPN domain-containing protein [Pandoraea pnomenusa]SUA81634.1 Uncharacterised protein [Pandoraea pnomenusa]